MGGISDKLSTSLLKYCRNSLNTAEDNFVGLKFNNEEDLEIIFPIGFNISKTEEGVYKDIILLINTLIEYGDEQSKLPESPYESSSQFPFYAYMIILNEYLSSGYMRDLISQFSIKNAGKINWNKTIKKCNPIIQTNGFVYTNFVIKDNFLSDNNLITEINKYCVYISSQRVGWLLKIPTIKTEIIRPEIEKYLSFLFESIRFINKDNEKKLYLAMIDILKYESSIIHNQKIFFGTYNFKYVWENIIEKNFGNEDRSEYFPRTSWILSENSHKKNRALEPDTVMKYKGDIYILDAKYYKYGITYHTKDLPSSSSINKQITYGEYVEKHLRNSSDIYNVFLLPYNSNSFSLTIKESSETYKYFGRAMSDWKKSNKTYHSILGILIDVKFLMQLKSYNREFEIQKLSEFILKVAKDK